MRGRARAGQGGIPEGGGAVVASAMRYPATLLVNGVPYPVDLDPGRTLLTALRDDLGLTGRRRAATTPSAAPAW